MTQYHVSYNTRQYVKTTLRSKETLYLEIVFKHIFLWNQEFLYYQDGGKVKEKDEASKINIGYQLKLKPPASATLSQTLQWPLCHGINLISSRVHRWSTLYILNKNYCIF